MKLLIVLCTVLAVCSAHTKFLTKPSEFDRDNLAKPELPSIGTLPIHPEHPESGPLPGRPPISTKPEDFDREILSKPVHPPINTLPILPESSEELPSVGLPGRPDYVPPMLHPDSSEGIDFIPPVAKPPTTIPDIPGNIEINGEHGPLIEMIINIINSRTNNQQTGGGYIAKRPFNKEILPVNTGYIARRPLNKEIIDNGFMAKRPENREILQGKPVTDAQDPLLHITFNIEE